MASNEQLTQVRALLLDDAALSELAPLTEGNAEQLDFACHLLRNLSLVKMQAGCLVTCPRVMTRFLRAAPDEQYAIIFQAYASLLSWSELDVLLRGDDRLKVQPAVYPLLSYQQSRAQFVRLRCILLRFLATAGGQGWCTMADAETALRILWPLASNALQEKDPDGFGESWSLVWPHESGEQALDDDQKWQVAQGSCLRIMLEGPLHWLGLAELCPQDGQTAAFRLQSLADMLWDRPVASAEGVPPDEIISLNTESMTLNVHPSAVPPEAHELLGRIAQLGQTRPGRFVYRLDMHTVQAALKRGESLAELLAAWKETVPLPIPEPVHEALSTWWESYGQIRFCEGLALLELGDDSALAELEATTSLGQHILARLSPRFVLVPDDAVDGLLREFAAKGHTPTLAR